MTYVPISGTGSILWTDRPPPILVDLFEIPNHPGSLRYADRSGDGRRAKCGEVSSWGSRVTSDALNALEGYRKP